MVREFPLALWLNSAGTSFPGKHAHPGNLAHLLLDRVPTYFRPSRNDLWIIDFLASWLRLKHLVKLSATFVEWKQLGTLWSDWKPFAFSVMSSVETMSGNDWSFSHLVRKICLRLKDMKLGVKVLNHKHPTILTLSIDIKFNPSGITSRFMQNIIISSCSLWRFEIEDGISTKLMQPLRSNNSRFLEFERSGTSFKFPDPDKFIFVRFVSGWKLKNLHTR